tara:strand:+ start:7524 stop:7631 length:108 start_codon:yes stop_codon:yes gene_type:complete
MVLIKQHDGVFSALLFLISAPIAQAKKRQLPFGLF